jgi:hypothetical protein
MRCWPFFLLLVTVAMLSSGCATSHDDNVSTIPWNRPQPWEGTGALGSIVRPPGSP